MSNKVRLVADFDTETPAEKLAIERFEAERERRGALVGKDKIHATDMLRAIVIDWATERADGRADNGNGHRERMERDDAREYPMEEPPKTDASGLYYA
jgi:hypothetical protein